MASKKRGLGKTLADVLAENNQRIDNARLIPTSLPPSDYDPEDLNEDYVIIPRADRTRRKEDVPENFIPLDEADYEAYTGIHWVTPDRDPATYGQGPDRSPRVAAHKLVPYGTLMNRSMGNQAATAAGIRYGTVYVKFQNNGNIYRYDHVPDHVYQTFRNNNSKGKFINDFLNNYPYSPAPNDSNASDL